MQSAPLEVVRVAPKNIFKERKGLVVFLVLIGNLGQPDPAWEIVRRLLGHLRGDLSHLVGVTGVPLELRVFHTLDGPNRREVCRFLEFFAGFFQVFLEQMQICQRQVRLG